MAPFSHTKNVLLGSVHYFRKYTSLTQIFSAPHILTISPEPYKVNILNIKKAQNKFLVIVSCSANYPR